MAFSAAGFIFHVIATTDADIEGRYNEDTFNNVGTGTTFVVLFRYKPGRNPIAHGFRAWTYMTSEGRETDFEADMGTGLAMNTPQNILFTPNAPQSASNPNEWLFGQMIARTEAREAFDDDAEDHTYYLKISILQGQQGATTAVPGSESVEVSPETPPGPGPVANLSSQTNAEDNTITVTWEAPTDNNGAEVTGYEVRVQAGGTGFTNWEIALFSLTLDAVYLATVVAALGLIVPGVRILIELEVRAVNLNGGGQISRAIWNWPVDVWGPSVPTSFIVTPQLQIPGIIGIDVHLSWDFPADTGNTFIESYEYRYKDSTAAHYNDYVSTTERSARITGLMPAISYDFQVRAKNGAGYYGGNATRTVTTT